MLFKVVTTEKQLDINVDKKQLKHGRVGGELGAKKVPRRNGTARDCRDAGEGTRRMVPRLQNERRYSCLRTERPPTAASKVMRCFFMRGGHITAVELLPGLNDVEAVAKSHELFEARKREAGYEGFEVWQEARMVIQHPPAPIFDGEAIAPRGGDPPAD
jgi:hypothetical protein